MKPRLKSVFAVVLLTYWTSAAYSAGPLRLIKVAVRCEGSDPLGQRVCFDLKEKIRASVGFELVSSDEAKHSKQGFGVYLASTSVYPDQNPASAIAVLFTVPMPSPKLDGFLDLVVLSFGSANIEGVAANILAAIEKDSEFLRNQP